MSLCVVRRVLPAGPLLGRAMSFSLVGVSGEGTTFIVNSDDLPQPPPAPNFSSSTQSSTDVCCILLSSSYILSTHVIILMLISQDNLHHHSLQQLLEHLLLRQQLQFHLNNQLGTTRLLNILQSSMEPISFARFEEAFVSVCSSSHAVFFLHSYN